MDGAFGDKEGETLETNVGKTIHIDEYTLFNPHRPEEKWQHDTGHNRGSTTKYDSAVDCKGFRMTDNDYNKRIK